MLSLITIHTHIPNPHPAFSPSNRPLVPSLILEYNPKKRATRCKIFRPFLGFTEGRTAWRFRGDLDSSWCCWCKQGEGDVELEAEIMDFMAKSDKPEMFPTKKELIRAGRIDLVNAIKEKGGWYSFGWEEENVGYNVEETTGSDIMEFQRRVESYKTASSRVDYGDSFSASDKEDGFSCDSLQLAESASLDRSLENRNSGIEGILNRLEKLRNSNFGIHFGINGINGYEDPADNKDEGDEMHYVTPAGDVARTDLGENGRVTPGFHQKGNLSTSGSKISPVEPETWRTWVHRRAGFQHAEFEAAEISYTKDQVGTGEESHRDEVTVTAEEFAKTWEEHKETSHNQIRTRLQHLECELTTALHSLRSKRDKFNSEEVTGSSSDLPNLSDAWEFQENDLMSAKERLRSIRSNMSVLEGKMALAIINAQKIVEAKQRRIDGAHKALQLLRSTCIVWPNSGSEVLLAGSFDGWTSQRKMEKSKSGIFSVSLKLYPGRYEIKFIVDGVWKTDPLRPIVKTSGHENNIFIVT